MFIKNLIDNMGKVNLFTRPRRFGKTLTLDMSLIPVGELTIVGSRCGPFEPALRLLDEQKVHFPEVELYDLKDYEASFASKAFKAGFRI